MSKTEFIYGYQTLIEILRHHPGIVKKIVIQENRNDDRVRNIQELAEKAKLSITWSSKRELDHLIGTVTHQGMVAECTKIPVFNESFLSEFLEQEPKTVLFLILDGVQDPHNLGACIRTANAMGVDAVIVPKDRAVGLTDTVHKTACGATAVTPFVQVTNLVRTMQDLQQQGVWLVGMDAQAQENIGESNYGSRVGLVMGSEGEGLRRLTKEHCDYLVKIPMRGTVDSLNVSVATAIGLYALNNLS